MVDAFVQDIVRSSLSANDGTREVTQSATAVVKAGAAKPIADAISTLHGVGKEIAITRKELVFESDSSGKIIAQRDIALRDVVLERYTETSLDAIGAINTNLAKLTA